MEKRKKVLAENLQEELSGRGTVTGAEILKIVSNYSDADEAQIYHLMEEGVLEVEEASSTITGYSFKINESVLSPRIIKKVFLDISTSASSNFNIVSNSPPMESFDNVDLPKIYPRIIRLINSADSELLITNPYFDKESMRKINKPLSYAEKHGVEIKMLLRADEVPDDPSVMIDTLKHGELRKFGGKEDDERYFLHSKLLVADGRRAYIGSANLTSTSLGSNSEIGVIIEGDEISELKKYFDILWDEARPVE